MTGRWTTFITAVLASRNLRGGLLAVYYAAIVLGLIVMYGRGDFSTPSFVYQGL